MQLSCGNCKAIQSFSGDPLKCDVCGWVYQPLSSSVPPKEHSPVIGTQPPVPLTKPPSKTNDTSSGCLLTYRYHLNFNGNAALRIRRFRLFTRLRRHHLNFGRNVALRRRCPGQRNHRSNSLRKSEQFGVPCRGYRSARSIVESASIRFWRTSRGIIANDAGMST